MSITNNRSDSGHGNRRDNRPGRASDAIPGISESAEQKPLSWRGIRHRTVAACTALTLTFGWAVDSSAARQARAFDTPQAAAGAMVEALGSDDGFAALLNLLGDQFKKQLEGGDKAAARVQVAKVHAAALQSHSLRNDGDDRRIMLIGPNVWPVPFPIVRENGRWSFDTAAGIEEVINRRIGRNELNAIAVARAYLAAQRKYASVDRDGDEVREYATRISSRPGKRDGLYWEIDEQSGEPLSPFGPLVADGRAYLDDYEPGDPYQGYYFKVLTRQGLNPPGGRYDYVINNNMIGGFALAAFPADYGNSGVMSFVVSHHGKILHKDLGENTDVIVGGMREYNPDETWTDAEN